MRVSDGIGIARVEQLVVAVWRDSGGGGSRTAIFRDALAEAARSAHREILVLNVILPTSDPPDGAAREHVKQSYLLLGERFRGAAHYLIGNSLRVSLGRTFLRGMFLIGPHGGLHSVAAHLKGALDYFEKRTATPLDRARVAAQLDELLVALGVAPLSAPGVMPR